MNTKFECIKTEVEQELNKLNGTLATNIDKIKSSNYESMITQPVNLKMYYIAYNGADICNRYGITNEDDIQELFETFCENEYENMEDYLNEEISNAGYSYEWKDLTIPVGRTSSFFVNPWADDFGNTVEDVVIGYMAEQFGLEYYNYVEIDYKTNKFKVVHYSDDDNELLEALEDLKSINEAIDDQYGCDITKDDDYLMCKVVWNYIKEFKRIGADIFEADYVKARADEILEVEYSELLARKEKLNQQLKEQYWLYDTLEGSRDLKRYDVQDVINLVWSSLDTDHKKQLMDLLKVSRF